MVNVAVGQPDPGVLNESGRVVVDDGLRALRKATSMGKVEAGRRSDKEG